MYLKLRLVWSQSVVAARDKRNSDAETLGPHEDCFDFLKHLSNVARELEACKIANPRLENTIKFNWHEMTFVFSIWENHMPVEQQLLQEWFNLRKDHTSTDGEYLFTVFNETLSREEYNDLIDNCF